MGREVALALHLCILLLYLLGCRQLGERAAFRGALALGLVGRFMAFGIAATMLGAVWMVHGHNGFFMNWSGKQPGEGYEYHLLAIGIGLALVLTGAGKWSVAPASTVIFLRANAARASSRVVGRR